MFLDFTHNVLVGRGVWTRPEYDAGAVENRRVCRFRRDYFDSEWIPVRRRCSKRDRGACKRRTADIGVRRRRRTVGKILSAYGLGIDAIEKCDHTHVGNPGCVPSSRLLGRFGDDVHRSGIERRPGRIGQCASGDGLLFVVIFWSRKVGDGKTELKLLILSLRAYVKLLEANNAMFGIELANVVL